MEENEKVMNRGGVGRLIPAGTGMPVYREVYLEKDNQSHVSEIERGVNPCSPAPIIVTLP
jgi:hypothetical protein